jgi:hypothetical protein
MGDDTARTILCSTCATPWASTDTACPSCGSPKRTVALYLTGTIMPRSRLHLRARHGQPGKVTPHLEIIDGSDQFRDTGEWRQVRRVIDRESNHYTERILDADGNVVREVDEPLSRHTERGAAKSSPSTP